MKFRQRASVHYGTFNCYAYALNQTHLGHLQPGGVHAKKNQALEYWTDHSMHKLLLQDGLVPAKDRKFDPASQHVIAAFVAVDHLDFHFCRLNANGTWSHKMGKSRPMNRRFYDLRPPRAPEKLVDPKEYAFIDFYTVPPLGLYFRP